MDLPHGEVASRFYAVEGRRVHARESVDDGAPAGRVPVVLVHGQVVSSRYMLPLARRIAPHRRVLAPDLPGYGLSDDPGYPLDLEGLVDALARILTAAGIERAALVGNSFGCEIAAAFAVRHPERVACAILQGPTADPAARTWWQQTWRWLQNAPREPWTLGAILALDYRDAGLRRSLATFRLVLADPVEATLPKVAAPALVVRGSDDPMVPQAWAEQAAELLPNGRLHVIPGVPHTANYTAADEMARLVRSFVDAQEEDAA